MAAKPFLDTTLEDKILRFCSFDNDKDDPTIETEILINIGYAFNLGVSKDMFESPFKQWLFQTAIEHYMKFSEVFSKLVAQKELKRKFKNIDEFRKNSILLDNIFEVQFERKTFKNYVQDIKNLNNYRNLVDLVQVTNDKLRNDHENLITDNSVSIAQGIQDVVSNILTGSDKMTVIEEDVFHNLDKDIATIKDKKLNPEKYVGISSGFKALDDLTGGWMPGDLDIVLGRPGVGKSTMLLNFAHSAYLNKDDVIYVTIEMNIDSQKERFYSLLLNEDYNKIRFPQSMSDEQISHIEKMLRKAKEKMNNYLYFIDAPGSCNAAFLESRILSFENSLGRKASLVIIDPIYLMKPVNLKTDDWVGTISWELKLMARKLKVPVLVASQFNRDSVKRQKRGAGDTVDAAFSDKLGQNADLMIGLKSDGGDRMKLEMIKSRNSRKIDIYIKREEGTMRFKSDDDFNAGEEDGTEGN